MKQQRPRSGGLSNAIFTILVPGMIMLGYRARCCHAFGTQILFGMGRIQTPHSFTGALAPAPRSVSTVASSVDDDSPTVSCNMSQKIAIIGGGLAGLSTAYHLLEKIHERNDQHSVELTVLDTHNVGMGGASAVAGG
jgi:hypothetical protein